MRELKAARNNQGMTYATDEKSADGANHHYAFSYQPTPGGPVVDMGSIKFQNGDPGTAGVNGVSDEQVLQVLIDHVGSLKGNDNYQATNHLRDALSWLENRPQKQALGAAKP